MDFEQVYYQFKSMVTAICYTYTHNLSDTEDLVQEVFIKYNDKKPVFRSVDDLKYWLIRVSINASKNFIKSNWKKKVHFDSNLVDIAQNPERKDEEVVFDIVNMLPDIYKDVIALHYYDDISIKEMSIILKTSEASIKKRLERARNIVRAKLEEIKHD